MLRLIVQKARSHFNTALEYAERDRNEEAIAELNNALELDRSHVNSHVVLGSLHAKLGMMEKAEECWREALRLDSRFDKAHEYLLKSDAGRRSLPIVRRQRFYMIGMIVMMAVLGVWLAILQWHSANVPSYSKIHLAWTLYNKSNDSAALDELRKIPKQARNTPIGGQAALLAEMIHAREELLLSAGQQYLAQMDLRNAADQITELINRFPPAQMTEKATAVKDRIIETAQKVVTVGLESMQRGTISGESVRRSVDLYRSILGPKDAQDDAFLKTADQTLNVFIRQQKIANVIQRFKEKKIDEIGLITEFVALRGQYPGYAKKLQELIDAFYLPQEKRIAATIEYDLSNGDADSAAESIDALNRLMEAAHASQAAPRIAAYGKRLESVRTENMLRQVRADFSAGKFEQAVEVGQAVLQKPIDDTSRAVVQSVLTEANQKLASQRWLWMRSLDRNYIDERISIDEAEKTIRYYPQTEKYLSRNAYPNVADDMLFYLGMAYRRIGQKDKSNAAFDQLLAKQPKSNFVRWVKHYRDIDAAPKPAPTKKAAPASSVVKAKPAAKPSPAAVPVSKKSKSDSGK